MEATSLGPEMISYEFKHFLTKRPLKANNFWDIWQVKALNGLRFPLEHHTSVVYGKPP